MGIELPLASMTTAEKLEALDALWNDLSRAPDVIESPAWHGEVLAERGQATDERFVDWEEVKQQVRERLR
ncbi:Putative addiction module component [Franzmannia pantelleriensis]|uniref:Acyl-protein synthetase n=2 Tax=Halomonadaceae TaxID=28256 RepID=A0A2A2EWQ1_9GAMM|nr:MULTISPECIES: addiction module protein [Halomonas]PAU76894.1 acyl-protein synthetase [Halomonas salipaludis]SDK95437.1 Putative addiction module component [Halomonas pantelleriensis]